MENGTKKWWQSRGVLGALITIAVLVLGLFGVDVDEGDQAGYDQPDRSHHRRRHGSDRRCDRYLGPNQGV